MKRCLLMGVLVLALNGWVQAQQPEKLTPAPKDFDAKRKDIERGKVETLEYESKTVGGKRKVVVYTPPGYSKDNKYPIFYLLHGLGGNEGNWTKGGAAHIILDNLYADKKVVPMIVVMPNGMVEAPGGKGKDYISGFENELLKDVMPFVEGRYPIEADADHRALAGLSMGGGQSLRVGLKHLDKFAWIGGYSSALIGGKGTPLPSGDDAKKIRLLYVACGDADTLFKNNEAFHTSLEKARLQHIWYVHPGGKHDFVAWRDDLYHFAPLLFKEKKEEKVEEKK
jgi:enterochelin esterase-like enzyme